MQDEPMNKVKVAADKVLQMAAELEASGDTTLAGAHLEQVKILLHSWVETVVGVVTTPSFGRVTLIHQDGGTSTISARDLPFTLTKPVEWNEPSAP